MRKLLVIGIDAASWEIIRAAEKVSKIPAIQKLISSGDCRKLRSTIPAHSAPAWTSAFTGVNPGKHGVFDFFKWERFERKLVHSGDVKARYVWDIAGASGKRSIVVNVPMTYPPSPLNGTMISGIPAPSESSNFTYPAELAQKLPTFGYRIDPKHSNIEEDYASLINAEKARTETMSYLMKSLDWDLAIIVFTALDRIQHRYWYVSPDLRDSRQNKIIEAYNQIDSYVSTILEASPRETEIIVISDHGFTGCNGVFYVNEWLQRHGFLKGRTTQTKKVLRSLGITREGLKRKTPRTLIQKMPKSVSRAIPTKNQAREDIDWSSTSAWLSSPGGQGIIINPDKEKKDYDQIKESLSKTLGEVVWKDDGPVLKAALPRGKVYWGPHVDSGPDIVLALSDGWRVSESMAKPIMEKSDEGWHHREAYSLGMAVSPKMVICRPRLSFGISRRL